MKQFVQTRQAQGQAQQAAARHTPAAVLSAGQTRALRRLQQRREAKKGKQEPPEECLPAATAVTAPLDDSWIDELEQEEAKAREAKEAKANAKRGRKERMKANKAKQSNAEPEPPEEAEEVEPEAADEADEPSVEAPGSHADEGEDGEDAEEAAEEEEAEEDDDAQDEEEVEEEDEQEEPEHQLVKDEATTSSSTTWEVALGNKMKKSAMRSVEEDAAGQEVEQPDEEVLAKSDRRRNQAEVPAAVVQEPQGVSHTSSSASKAVEAKAAPQPATQPPSPPPQKKSEGTPQPKKSAWGNPSGAEELVSADPTPAEALGKGAASALATAAGKRSVAVSEAAQLAAQSLKLRLAVEREQHMRTMQECAPAPAEQHQAAGGGSGGTTLGAHAPEFIPMAMMQPGVVVGAEALTAAREQAEKNAAMESMLSGDLPLTTVVISGIPDHTPSSFKQQLDSWGLVGTYNFICMQSDNEAVVNFIDPMFATFCMNILQQCQFEGVTMLSPVQGLDNNIAHFNSSKVSDNPKNQPLIFHTPVPSEWAVNGVNSMLDTKFSPQIRDQFHKTKLCTFHKKKRCALGSSCPFAHHKDELQQAPDLHKTKLCYNFFRRKCNDKNCKFAHGYQELRATSGVYKTELCRWWAFGACKAGNACRYAHGVEELRGWQGNASELPDAGRNSFQAVQGYQDYHQSQEGQSGQAAEGGIWHPRQQLCPKAQQQDWQQSQQRKSSGLNEALKDASSEVSFSRQNSGDLNSEADASSVSDMSSLNFGGNYGAIYRQQTAPPSYSPIPEMPAVSDDLQDGFVLRVKGTFMEAVQLKADPPMSMRRRSWSDGDLPQLSEVMAGMEEEEDGFGFD
mmetsp:Transcript_34697/g.79510  ORF Transcript_34697/g.79510 Transcript_34697/m.79510 type:complete len:849 (-) Transcript_34697:241-2787(-)